MGSSKVALVIGASRGIGRQIAVTLSKNNFKVGVAAKTTQNSEKNPGTIFSVCEEIKSHGGDALPIQCDVRQADQIEKAVSVCKKKLGIPDFVVYNAGAITWKPVVDTPLKRFDLMNDINMRGAYTLVHGVLPEFLKRNTGKILLVSPPIYSRFFKGKTPYAMTKVGMTVLVHGLAHELKDTGVSISSLWPTTAIESHVTAVNKISPTIMRKATIFADACLQIAQEPSNKYNGRALLDEDLLQEIGMTDFAKYRCDPNAEPPRMMPKTFPSLLVDEENFSLDAFSKL